MKCSRTTNRASNLVFAVVLIAIVTTSYGWIQPKYTQSFPSQLSTRIPRSPVYLSTKTTISHTLSSNQQNEISEDTWRDSFRCSLPRLGKKLKFLLPCLLGLAGLTLLPMRAAASTMEAAPLIVADAVSVAAATAAVAPTVVTPYVLNAGPPISAAVETMLCFRLLWAALLGSALGKERSLTKHSAGVRTMALVAMGASAFTICSAFGFAHIGRYDPSRMAANVASGVGFVGAGVITTSARDNPNLSHKQNVVHGLTTAATIWLSAAVGVSCGVGLYRVSTTATIATIAILRLGRRKPENRLSRSSTPSVAAPHFVSSTQDHVEANTPAQLQVDDYSETLDTSAWDEHHVAPSPPVQVQHISQSDNVDDEKEVGKEVALSNVSFGDNGDMEEIVRKAWSNSTHADFHIQQYDKLSKDRSRELLVKTRSSDRRP